MALASGTRCADPYGRASPDSEWPCRITSEAPRAVFNTVLHSLGSARPPTGGVWAPWLLTSSWLGLGPGRPAPSNRRCPNHSPPTFSFITSLAPDTQQMESKGKTTKGVGVETLP